MIQRQQGSEQPWCPMGLCTRGTHVSAVGCGGMGWGQPALMVRYRSSLGNRTSRKKDILQSRSRDLNSFSKSLRGTEGERVRGNRLQRGMVGEQDETEGDSGGTGLHRGSWKWPALQTSGK